MNFFVQYEMKFALNYAGHELNEGWVYAGLFIDSRPALISADLPRTNGRLGILARLIWKRWYALYRDC